MMDPRTIAVKYVRSGWFAIPSPSPTALKPYPNPNPNPNPNTNPNTDATPTHLLLTPEPNL